MFVFMSSDLVVPVLSMMDYIDILPHLIIQHHFCTISSFPTFFALQMSLGRECDLGI